MEIEDIYLKNSLSQDSDAAILSVSTTLMNRDETHKPAKVYVSLIDDSTDEAQTIKGDARMVVKEDGLSSISIDLEIDHPKLWSPDNPFLYRVMVEITDHYDTVMLREELNHGFRTVEVQEDILLVNGQRAMIKEAHLIEFEDGIDFEPDKENYVAYLKHLKECNINTIWTGKELEDSLFYDLCDLYGFFIFEQMHSEVGPRLVRRHRNHPSIVLWIIDESGLNDKEALEHRNKMITQDYSRPYSYRDDKLPAMTYIEEAFEVQWNVGQADFTVTSLVSTFPEDTVELWLIRTVDGEVVEELEVEAFQRNSEKEFKTSNDFLQWKGVESSFSHVAFEVRLSENTWWQKRGYVIASSTFTITEPVYSEIPLEHSGYCKVDEKAEVFVVKGQFGRLEISKETGLINQLTVKDYPLLSSPIRPNMWMDNKDQPDAVDKDFYWMFKVLKKDPWETAIETMSVKNISHKMNKELAEFVIESKVKGLSGLLKVTYRISNQGEFTIIYEGTAAKDMHRIGLTMALAIDCNQINYFGEGPYASAYNSAEAKRCKVHDLDYSTEFLKGAEQTYKRVSWLTMNNQASLGLMFEQFSAERFQVVSEGRKLVVESIDPPKKSESFVFAVKCLLLYE